ncbi:MAG: hypothetical protein FJ319_07340 [SAR202 cluster bacterium]|nr:hypothetical protein [SAR202 cluster bacterium]
MIARRNRLPGLLHLFLLFSILIVTLACAPEDDPFNVGDRARISAEATAAAAQGQSSTPTLSTEGNRSVLQNEGKGTVRFADWSDNEIALLNNIAGYILVWGYDYKAELVDVNEGGYQAAATDGKVDVVMGVPKATASDWLKQQADSGKLVDASSPYGADGEIRIAHTTALKSGSAEVADFLQKISVDHQLITNQAAQISGGRTGIRPIVAALTFLKNNEPVWTAWLPVPIAENVKTSIAAGKTSLVKRDCIPTGGSRSPGNPNEENC